MLVITIVCVMVMAVIMCMVMRMVMRVIMRMSVTEFVCNFTKAAAVARHGLLVIHGILNMFFQQRKNFFFKTEIIATVKNDLRKLLLQTRHLSFDAFDQRAGE